MFYKREASGYRDPVPGVHMKTLTHGEHTLFTEFRLDAGHALPMHAHEQEQTGYLVSGAIRLHIGGVAHDVAPGDCWCIAGGVEHGADILADSVAIEVFSPVRADYLPAAGA